jgi:pyridoxine 4-dehydrogenase
MHVRNLVEILEWTRLICIKFICLTVSYYISSKILCCFVFRCVVLISLHIRSHNILHPVIILVVQPLRSFGKVENKDSIYWEGLAECYNRGLVKNVGVCNYGPTLVEECQKALAKKGVPLASNQITFSLLGRHNGSQETVTKCNELGIKVLACYPFAMGLLTGKYSKTILDQNADSLTLNKKSNMELKDLERYAYGDGITVPEGGIQPLLVTMASIAKERNKSISQIALNYIISKGAIPIPGCRTATQLEDNLGAMGWRLSETEIKKLELQADSLGFGFDGAGFKRTDEKFVGYGVEKWTLD